MFQSRPVNFRILGRVGRSSTARERLLDAAGELMQSRAYGSLGVAEICTRADVRKGSFYHFFESKQALTLATIDARWQAEGALWDTALDVEAPALTRLGRLLATLIAEQHRAHRRSGVVHGCLYANLALELSTQDRLVQTRLEEIFNEQIALVQAVLEDAAAEQAVPPESGDRATARAVLAQYEGIVMFAKIGNDPGVLDDIWEQTMRIIGAKIPLTLG
jgi:TetR/AcrR family transcriptional regulator, transcriptional repressor for nem operon